MIPESMECGVAAQALAGQTTSGDRHLVHRFDGGVLIAVVDGVGHGPEAAVAAERAIEILRTHARERVVALLDRCHEQLRGTRGAAMSVVSLDERKAELSWAGVGNVDGVVLRIDPQMTVPRRTHLILRGGLLGVQTAPPLVSRLAVRAGDMLALATDGVRGDLTPILATFAPPQKIADRILRQHATGTDDALVLVARYHGSGS